MGSPVTAYHNVRWTCPGCGFEGTTSAHSPEPITDHWCGLDECQEEKAAGDAVRRAIGFKPYRVTMYKQPSGAPHVWSVRAVGPNAAEEKAARKAAGRDGGQPSDYVLIRMREIDAPQRSRD